MLYTRYDGHLCISSHFRGDEVVQRPGTASVSSTPRHTDSRKSLDAKYQHQGSSSLSSSTRAASPATPSATSPPATSASSGRVAASSSQRLLSLAQQEGVKGGGYPGTDPHLTMGGSPHSPAGLFPGDEGGLGLNDGEGVAPPPELSEEGQIAVDALMAGLDVEFQVSVIQR